MTTVFLRFGGEIAAFAELTRLVFMIWLERKKMQQADSQVYIDLRVIHLETKLQ